MNASKIVVPVATALAATHYAATNAVWAQAGGLESAATTTGTEILNVILALMPIVLLALVVLAALMIASRKFGFAAIGAVVVGAWVAGNAELVLNTFGVAI